MDGTTQLAIAELVIYSLLFPAAILILLKHGKRGLEGWLFFLAFVSLRVVAGGLQIQNWHKIKDGKASSDTASIVNSIGVSALLLCTCGVLREARTYDPLHNREIGWIVVIVNHAVVAGGIAMSAIGGSKLSEATNAHDRDSDKNLLIAGYFIILATMIGQLVYALLSLKALRRAILVQHAEAKSHVSMLIYAAMLAVTVLFARIVYSIVYGFTLKPSLSPYTGSLAVKVVLIFLVQLFAALVLGIAGIWTRNLAEEKALAAARTPEGHESQLKA